MAEAAGGAVVDLRTVTFSVPLEPPPGGRSHPLSVYHLDHCLVRAETRDGRVGWGEISDGWGCEYPGVATAIVTEALSRFVVGRDPGDVAGIVDTIRGWVRRRQGTVWLMAQAIGGVEIALWDLEAQRRGVPVSAALGPALRAAIPVYASGHFLGQADAAHHAASFADALARNVDLVKVRIGADWRADLETLAELRAVLPGGVGIGIDGNEAFSPKTAGAIAARFAELGIAFFEEPCPRADREGLRRLVANSRVPIAYGEHVHTAAGFRELDEQGHADVWQPDATVCGGLLEGRAIADLAAQIGRPVSPHSATSPVGIAANLHLAAIAPTLGHLEFASGAVRRLAPFFPGAATAADITGGALAVPSGPGLGVRPDEEALLAEFPLQPKPPVHSRPALYLGSI